MDWSKIRALAIRATIDYFKAHPEENALQGFVRVDPGLALKEFTRRLDDGWFEYEDAYKSWPLEYVKYLEFLRWMGYFADGTPTPKDEEYVPPPVEIVDVDVESSVDTDDEPFADKFAENPSSQLLVPEVKEKKAEGRPKKGTLPVAVQERLDADDDVIAVARAVEGDEKAVEYARLLVAREKAAKLKAAQRAKAKLAKEAKGEVTRSVGAPKGTKKATTVSFVPRVVLSDQQKADAAVAVAHTRMRDADDTLRRLHAEPSITPEGSTDSFWSPPSEATLAATAKRRAERATDKADRIAQAFVAAQRAVEAARDADNAAAAVRTMGTLRRPSRRSLTPDPDDELLDAVPEWRPMPPGRGRGGGRGF